MVIAEIFGKIHKYEGLGADDCADPSTTDTAPLCAPGMSRGPSALQVSFARWLPPNILLHFYISTKPKFISSAFFWESEAFGQKAFEVKIVLLLGFKVNVMASTFRFQTCFELQPFFAGPCPVVCMIRGAERMRKC